MKSAAHQSSVVSHHALLVGLCADGVAPGSSGSSAWGDGGDAGAAGSGSANGLSYGSTFGLAGADCPPISLNGSAGWADCASLLSSPSVSEIPCCTESRMERAVSSMVDCSFL